MPGKQVRWLLRELPGLVRARVVDPETAARIRDHYTAAPGTGRNWALTVFGLLGGSLIGLGVILLLAHNWADLPRPARLALGVLPLLVAQGLAAWRVASGRLTAPWREGVGLLWTAATGAAIAVVAQTYHIPGDAGRFALTWMLLTLPIVYLLRATGPALVYLVGITFWAMDAQWSAGHALGLWPLAALVVPHTLRASRADVYGAEAVALYWGWVFLACVAVGVTLEKVLPGLWTVVYSGLFACFYLAGAYWFDDAVTWWQRPFSVAGFLGLVVLAFMFGYAWPWEEVGWHHLRAGTAYHTWAAGLDYVLAAVLPITALCLLVTCLRRHKLYTLFLGAMPILALLGYAAVASSDETAAVLVLFNLYVLVAGVGYLARGFRTRQLGTVNAGLLMLFALILLRFFDAEMSFIARGLLFIALGLAFLGTNVVLARRRRAGA